MFFFFVNALNARILLDDAGLRERGTLDALETSDVESYVVEKFFSTRSEQRFELVERRASVARRAELREMESHDEVGHRAAQFDFFVTFEPVSEEI